MTRGEQPTVFSLKSRRSLPARPPVGGEYGAISSTALRGKGSVKPRFKPHLHRSGMCFQPFRASQRGDRRSQVFQRRDVELLNGDHFHEIGGGKPPRNRAAPLVGSTWFGPEA